jgi:hypothetical protein
MPLVARSTRDEPRAFSTRRLFNKAGGTPAPLSGLFSLLGGLGFGDDFLGDV